MALYPLDIPWAVQPPSRVSPGPHGFGPHILWDAIPGWNNLYGEVGGTFKGGIYTGGRGANQGQFFAVNQYAGTDGKAYVRTEQFPHTGLARVLRFEGSTGGVRLLRSNPADGGIQWPRDNNICMIVIFRPTGNGSINGSDPRIVSEDIGFGESDHKFMLGSTNSGDNARTRIRLNGTTRTVIAGSSMIARDKINILVGGVIPDGANFRTYTAILDEDGIYAYGESATASAGLTDISGLSQAIGCNAEQVNGFIGSILGAWALDVALTTEEQLRAFYRCVWLNYMPDTVVMPVSGVGEDASGAATLSPAVAAATAKVGRKASGAASLAVTTASGAASRIAKGSGASTLAKVSASGAASRTTKGSGSSTLAKASASGVASVRRIATGTPALSPVTAAGVASVRKSASGAASLAAFVGSGVATSAGAKTSSGAATLAVVEAAGMAKVRRSASGSGSLAAFLASGVAQRNPSANGAVQLAPFTASGSATRSLKASGTPSLTPFTGAGTAQRNPNATGAPGLTPFTASGVASRIPQASGSATLAVISGSGSGGTDLAVIIDTVELVARQIGVDLTARNYRAADLTARQIAVDLKADK